MKRLGLWAFLVAGLAVVAWSTASWIAPSTTCRGVEMGPGDTCEVSDRDNVHTGTVQTYEQRLEVTRSQAPFAAIAGVGMAGFGAWLLRQDAKAGETAPVRD
ncbi:MAG: hypothetical protein Q4G35_07305 [Propionibacteriaceae bacterium]|nr:hypothetical protein [Propionibacteriaceae bacterium]